MTVLDNIHQFSDRYGKQITVGERDWRYYRLGSGPAILWLTGGLRRSAFAFSFMEQLAERHLVIAPDYPPVTTIGEYMQAFDTMLQTEGVESCAVAGQSYGGMLAQAYLAHRPQAVERLILSSSGPADYGRNFLPAEWLLITLARLLPEKALLKMLFGGLFKLVSVPAELKLEWEEAFREIFEKELTRQDVISHFAVAADLIRTGLVKAGAFREWQGRVVVMSSENDRTQDKGDLVHYQGMFGREVEQVNMGQMGHTAVLFDAQKFLELIEQALI